MYTLILPPTPEVYAEVCKLLKEREISPITNSTQLRIIVKLPINNLVVREKIIELGCQVHPM